MGNGQLDTTFILKNLKIGTYNWSVQAIDNCFKGGAFSTNGSFTIRERVQANKFTVSEIDGSSALVKWNRGSLDNCIVFIKKGTGNFIPKNNSTYSASAIFGNGTNADDGWFCVYKGIGDNIKITGLTGHSEYTVQVMEYSGTEGSEQYFTSLSNDNTGSFLTKVFTSQTYLWNKWGAGNIFKSAWGDYDKDGYLDFVLLTSLGDIGFSQVFRNNGDMTFTEQSKFTLGGLINGSVAWGDYDNDGDLDILFSGRATTGRSMSGTYYEGSFITGIYKNNGNNSFTFQADIKLPHVELGSTNWGDYDKDGDLDILLTGSNSAKIFRNNGDNSFTEQTNIVLAKVYNSSADWGDYDNDGYLDILLTGAGMSKIYRNNGDNSFTDQTSISLKGIYDSKGTWGDYDNDGDLDVLLTGNDEKTNITRLYRNNGDNSFTEQSDSITGINGKFVDWADCDNDGDLDFIFLGKNISKIYRNDLTTVKAIVNNAPTDLESSVSGSDVVLKWKPIGIANALNYNVKVFTENDSIFINAPHSADNGFRHVVEMGNCQANASYTLKNLNPGTYYWKVQTIDKSFQGSTFSTIDSFTIKTSIQAKGISISQVNGSSALLKWKRGNLKKCVVFIKEGSGDFKPVDNTTYSASAVFGHGTNAGNGWFCIYNGVGNEIEISGLNGLANYTVQIFEYVGISGAEKYLTTSASDNPMNFKTYNFSIQSGISLAGVASGSSAWGDYDNDGFLDIILTGSIYDTAGPDYQKLITKIYHNNGDNSFTEQSNISFKGVESGSVDWGDYDNDGDLDLLLTGAGISKIYRNNGDKSFTEQTDIKLTGVYYSSTDWGDYDNDGDLDIILAGCIANSENICKVYQNNGNNSFTEQKSISSSGVGCSSVAWGDYDNDGDLDFLLTGAGTSNIYRNDGDNSFKEQTDIKLTGVFYSSSAWGDYDNDGDLDILLTGKWVSKIYRNNGDNNFTEQTDIILKQFENCSVAWGDYDNDGDLDILINGYDRGFFSMIYTNNGNNSFTLQTDISLTGANDGSVSWGDYDNDGDLDILLDYIVYRNFTTSNGPLQNPNKKPLSPTKLSVNKVNDETILSWEGDSTDETPLKALSYNIAFGKTKNDLFQGSLQNFGTNRSVVEIGNTGLNNFYKIKSDSVALYWAVQAVDGGFKGGNWSAVDSFNISDQSLIDYSIFPNPVYDIFTITSSYKIKSKVCIYTLNGKLLKIESMINKKIDIDIRNLPEGIYMVRIINDKNSVVKKIVKLS